MHRDDYCVQMSCRALEPASRGSCQWLQPSLIVVGIWIVATPAALSSPLLGTRETAAFRCSVAGMVHVSVAALVRPAPTGARAHEQKAAPCPYY